MKALKQETSEYLRHFADDLFDALIRSDQIRIPNLVCKFTIALPLPPHFLGFDFLLTRKDHFIGGIQDKYQVRFGNERAKS
jgi:hypothetical protein